MSWFVKSKRAMNDEDYETWVEGAVTPTLNAFDTGDSRAVVLIVGDTAVIPFVTNQRAEIREIGDKAVAISSSHGTNQTNYLAVIPINADALRGEGRARTPSPDAEGRVRLRDPGLGIGGEGDPAGTLAAAGPGAVAVFPADPSDVLAFSAGNSAAAYGVAYSENVTPPLRSSASGTNQVPTVVYPIQDGRGHEKHQNGLGVGSEGDPMYTIDTTGAQAVVYPLAVRGREGGSQLEVGPKGGPMNALRAGDGGSSRSPLVFIVTSDTTPKIGQDISPTLRISEANTQNVSVVYWITDDETVAEGVMPTIPTPSSSGGGHPPAVAITQNVSVAYGISSDAVDRTGEGRAGDAASRAGLGILPEQQPTLRARSNNAVAITRHVMSLQTANSSMQGPIFKDDVAWTVQPNPTRTAVAIIPAADPSEGDQKVIAFSHYSSDPGAGDISPTLRAGTNATGHAVAIMEAKAFTASEMANSFAWESDVYPTINAQLPSDTSNIQYGVRVTTVLGDITHTLTSEGHDAMDDGTGRGTPVVAYNIWSGSKRSDRPEGGMYVHEADVTRTLDASGGLEPSKNDGGVAIVSFSTPHAFYSTGGSHGLNSVPDVSPPLKVGSALGIPSPPAVAFQLNGDRANPGVSVSTERAFTLPANPMSDRGQAIAFTAKDYGADVGGVSPTLRAMPHADSHANGGGQVAVVQPMAYDEFNDTISETHHTLRSGTKQSTGVVAPTLSASNDPSRSPQSSEVTAMVAAVHAASPQTVVRRLTPTECERLQGFQDEWTAMGGNGKAQADSHRYRQLGNAVTVNVAEHVGRLLVDADARL